MRNKSVLILMSTYNGEKYLREQVDSIRSQQSDCQIHLLVRDDGSKDGTVDILHDLQKKYPDFMEVIEGKNMGYNGSFFELMKIASRKKYDYYAFSDQDDVWLKDKVQAAVTQLENMDSDMPALYGGCSYLTDEALKCTGVTTSTDAPLSVYNLIIQNFLPGHSQMFNYKLLEFILEHTQDVSKIYVYDSWMVCSALLTGKVYFDTEPHTYYRQHVGNGLGHADDRLRIMWFREKLKRIRHNDSKKYAVQIRYFLDTYMNMMDDNLKNELNSFFLSQNTFRERVRYIEKTKLYRLDHMQNCLFRLLYIMGGYSI